MLKGLCLTLYAFCAIISVLKQIGANMLNKQIIVYGANIIAQLKDIKLCAKIPKTKAQNFKE